MSKETLDALVIGAGFAGIAAARNLADAGYSVHLIEASDRLGGRTFTRPFRGRQDTVEFGGAWVNREIQPHIRREIDRYGVSLRSDRAPEHAVFLTDGVARDIPVPLTSLPDLERAWLHLHDASTRISTAAPLHTQPLRDLDVSAEEFFAPLGLSKPTQDLIYALLAGYVGCHPAQASMLGIVAQTAAFGGSPYGFYAAMKERFVGGTRGLLEMMVAQSAFDVTFNSPLTAIHQTSDEVTATIAGGREIAARACVVAIPTNVIRHVSFSPGLRTDKQQALSVNHVSRGYKLTLLAENLPSRPFALGMSELQMVVVGHEVGGGQYLLACAGAEGIARLEPLDRRAAELALRRYFPEARVLDCDAHDWNADPLFDGTWRADPPGVAYDFPRLMNEPEDRVFFAGTDLDSSVWRIWMEGALNNAHEVSHNVRVLLGAPSQRRRSRTAPPVSA